MNTFAVDARANLLIDIESEEDVLELPTFDPSRDYVMGGGSNILFETNVPGSVYRMQISGKDVVDSSPGHSLVEVGAGENWHDFVSWCVDRNLHGLENLSLIPGLVGAAPVQNIGAYGSELVTCVQSVTAWDWWKAQWRVFDREQCEFSYRSSRFKSRDSGRFLITSVRFRLAHEFSPMLSYAGLRESLDSTGDSTPTAREVANAVVRLRTSKLPDPAIEPNAGSFFKNPVVEAAQAERLLQSCPTLVHWPDSDGRVKFSAANMIEQCGLKGTLSAPGHAKISSLHALVLVNHDGAGGAEIGQLADHITETVHERFGVRLQAEVRRVAFNQPG